MAEVGIKIGIAPPSILGVSTIRVVVGTTISITKAMLMTSLPEYYHVDDLSIGSIEIVGGSIGGLTQTNTTDTIAVFTRTGVRIYRNSADNILNGVVSSSIINANNFRVLGHRIGQTLVKYKATAITNANDESPYTTSIQGTILILVVSAINQPPSAIGDSIVNCPYLGSVLIDATKFINGYEDPENDPPFQVRFNTVPPRGQSYLNGVLLTNGYVTTLANIQENPVVYISDETTTNNSIEDIIFSISDVGSGQFTT